jgi:hypothetical protein
MSKRRLVRKITALIDVIALMKRLPALQPGDLIAIMDAGAYFVPNQMNFSHTRPAAVMVEQGTATLIRDRESYEDIVALDRFASLPEELKPGAIVAPGDASTHQLSRAI